jgi:hypothetical protein
MTTCYTYRSYLLGVDIHVHVWLDYSNRCTCNTRRLRFRIESENGTA